MKVLHSQFLILDYIMVACKICSKKSELISTSLPICIDCIREGSERSLKIIERSHKDSRASFDLPHKPPKNGKVECPMCGNQCRMEDGEYGFCGLRYAKSGHLRTKGVGWLDWYYDPLPTNCVASFCCAGCTESGYPKFSYADGPEFGYKNLAVFYRACSFDCLFCQNYHFRESLGKRVSPEELLEKVDERTSCVCFFGGDPSPQINHTIRFAEKAKEKQRKLRICWETNGSMQLPYLKKITKIALESGGCIKFDLKAYDEKLNYALCGVSNKTTIDNFGHVSHFISERPNPPLLIASTLLVPGYIDVKEIKRIARFIAQFNPKIPYSLLCFHPQFYFRDIPVTSREHAYEAYDAALKEGLTNVHIGNKHLLLL